MLSWNIQPWKLASTNVEDVTQQRIHATHVVDLQLPSQLDLGSQCHFLSNCYAQVLGNAPDNSAQNVYSRLLEILEILYSTHVEGMVPTNR